MNIIYALAVSIIITLIIWFVFIWVAAILGLPQIVVSLVKVLIVISFLARVIRYLIQNPPTI